MENTDLSTLTDQELLAEAKKMKSSFLMNAFFVGFLIGIICYSIIKNSWGMLTLIPLYLIYRIVNDPKKKRGKELELLLQQRKLK